MGRAVQGVMPCKESGRVCCGPARWLGLDLRREYNELVRGDAPTFVGAHFLVRLAAGDSPVADTGGTVHPSPKPICNIIRYKLPAAQKRMSLNR